jgi:hypothetical protein
MASMIEVIAGRATNPAALTALTVNTGDTFAVRAFGEGAAPYLENVWTQQATAGIVRIRSPRLHDATQGIRLVANAALPQALLPLGSEQKLHQTDVLTFELQGGGAEVDAAAALICYANVNTGGARYAMWEQIKPLIQDILTVQVDVAGPATSGDWSAGTAFTNFSDLLKADAWYAILGYTLDTASLAVAIQGPDTGNYRVGGPGVLNSIETRDWFVRLSRAHGTPHIPIFNSQNDGATRVFVARVGAGGTINVSLIMARLSGAI